MNSTGGPVPDPRTGARVPPTSFAATSIAYTPAHDGWYCRTLRPGLSVVTTPATRARQRPSQSR
jgi:hypothetical protein